MRRALPIVVMGVSSACWHEGSGALRAEPHVQELWEAT